MFTVTTTNVATHDIVKSVTLESHAACIEWVRENLAEGEDFKIKEDPKPCRECGELCESRWSSLCRSCQFSLNDAVKAARKIIRSAKRNGNPVVAVNDGGDIVKGNERTLLEAVHSVDVSRLILQSGAQVLIIGGNESEADCIADYNTSLEAIIEDANLRDE